jgi:SAM-dependent methyltransferase
MSDAQTPLLLRPNRATNRLYYRLTKRPHHFALYRSLVGEAVARASAVVHLGAGSVFLGDVSAAPVDGKTIYAVEPDAETLATNRAPNRICAGGESIPLPDASVDAVVCEYVVEHLVEPERVLRELRRILRPGGRFVFVTPNAWSYSAIATRLTSQRFHEAFLGRLTKLGGSGNQKPFPTAFRMNTRGQIERLARDTGYVVHALHSCVDHPTYTYPFPLIHQLAVAWHLVLDKLDWLEPLRISWVCVLAKPA